MAKLFDIIMALPKDAIAMQTVIFWLLEVVHAPTSPYLRPC